MKKTIYSLLVVIPFLISGCGLKFSGNSFSNAKLPDTFKNRSVFPTDLSGAYQFADLTGAIIAVDTAKKNDKEPLLLGLIHPQNHVSKVIPIPESYSYYKSRVTKEASAEGSYLIAAASLNVDQMMEIEIVDVARSYIDFSTASPYQDVLKQIQEWVRLHPKTNSDTRIWIKEVVLTKIIVSNSAKVKSNASISSGSVAKIKGGIFNTSEQQNKSVQLGLVAYDIDKMARQTAEIVGIAGDQVDAKLNESKVNNLYSYKSIRKN